MMAIDELFQLNDRVAVVTGGTGALGTDIVLALAHAGAKVAVLARHAERIDEVTARVAAEGGEAIGVPCDVRDRTQLQHTAERVIEHFGRVDILVNGAGGNRPDATTLPDQRTFFELEEDALRWVVDLNLMGTLLPSQVFGATMARQQAGVILNVSSMAAFQPMTRVVGYAAAKAAINNFTQWLSVYMAREHSPDIRVNAIAPGFFLGEQNRYLLLNEDESLTERGQQIIDHTPMGRFGQPDDLAGAVIWLVSDAARFVTGIVVPIDGGFMAYSGV